MLREASMDSQARHAPDVAWAPVASCAVMVKRATAPAVCRASMPGPVDLKIIGLAASASAESLVTASAAAAPADILGMTQ